jgi:hypothetical protein
VSAETSAPDAPKSIRKFRVILFCDDQDLLPKHVASNWSGVDIPLIQLPLTFLQKHVFLTTQQLKSLISGVEKVERVVARGADIDRLKALIGELHSYNMDLIKLERRWRFQSELGITIEKFLCAYKNDGSEADAHSNQYDFKRRDEAEQADFQGQENGRFVRDHTYFQMLVSKVGFQRAMGNASEYDLNVLSRRIDNQFTAVCTLLRFAPTIG